MADLLAFPGKIKKKKPARRDYGGRPGVTTVIGQNLGWSKNALIGWAHKLGKEGRSMRERDDAAALGTATHAVAAALLGGEPTSDEDFAGVDRQIAEENGARIAEEVKLREWTVLAIELPIISERFGGTIDLVVRTKDGRVLIADIKTGRGLYEVAVQLGAYAWLWRQEVARREAVGTATALDIATEGAIIHAHPSEVLRVVDVPAAAMHAGEQTFRHLLEIHHMRDAVDIGEKAGAM